MSTIINIKDLPEHGLTLVAPSDPSFEGHASAILKGKNKHTTDTFSVLKPFCVVLSNATDRTVVAYQVKWEMTLADGAIVTRESSGSAPTPLMGGRPPGSENACDKGNAIAPKSRRLMYPGSPSLGDDQDYLIGGIAGGSRDPADLPRMRQAAQNKDYLAILRFSTAEWHGYNTVTASIDGAFFEDGTYVGPDATNFFATFQAMIDARRDLLEEISFGLAHKRTSQEILDDVAEIANGPDAAARWPVSTPSDYYNYNKRIHAQEIIRMRQALGERAISVALDPLRRPWPRLRKL